MRWLGKWNYRVSFSRRVPAEDRKRFLKPQAKLLYFKAKCLKPNEFEINIIENARLAIKEFLREHGFSSIPFKTSQIRIYSEKVFNVKVAGNEPSRAIYETGYVYLIRDLRIKWQFLNDLTHELSHLIAFQSFSIRRGKHNALNINHDRDGYYHAKGRLYEGLNEAATEICAIELRKKMATAIFSDPLQIARLFREIHYAPQVYLVKGLLHLSGEYERAMWLLIKSYIDGTNDFLEFLERKFSVSRDVLKTMGKDREEIMKIAQKIGSKKLHRYIKYELSVIDR